MIRSSVRSAGLAILLTMNGCGLVSSGIGGKTPGLTTAEAALRNGASDIALQVSEGVLRKSPDNIQALEIKADALALLGQSDQAAAIFASLLAHDPNSVRANTGLGRIKLGKDPAAAEALFQLVLKRDPKDLTALNNVGIARDLQGRHAEAQAAYRQALAIKPSLDSAQVNLALSLAMTGQGPAAVQLMQAKASEPGAQPKVRHDYAVVLAMAGNRPEADRVLREDMSAEDARQVLDAATGTHTKPIREVVPPDRIARDNRFNDEIPPDVVQVPEQPAQPVRMARVAAAPTVTPLAASPPMVVHPQQVVDPDAEPPMVQPVNPVSAAMVNQRPLAAPMRAVDLPAPAPAPAPVGPVVVAMPATPVRVAVAEVPRTVAAQVAAPAPVVAPVVAPVAVMPPAAPPPPVRVALAEPPRPVAAPVPAPVVAMPPAAPVRVALAEAPRPVAPPVAPPATVVAKVAIAPAAPARIVVASISPEPPRKSETRAIETEVTRTIPHDEAAQAVQFAATASEESAHAFWQSLVHRFPDALGQRAPTVIRFERGGTVFWRVRTEGFASLSEAQSLCARMRAGGQDCFVPRS